MQKVLNPSEIKTTNLLLLISTKLKIKTLRVVLNYRLIVSMLSMVPYASRLKTFLCLLMLMRNFN